MRNSGTNNRGQVLIFAVILLGVIAVFLAVLGGVILSSSRSESRETKNALALQLAEAGIDRALWCLNHALECPADYNSETQTLGAGSFTVTITPSGANRILTSTGTVQEVSRTIEVTAKTSTTDVAFYYGVQVGAGGLVMGNNAKIIGNVFSNGSIISGNNGKVQGSALVGAGTALAPDQQQMNQTSDFTVGQTAAQTDAAQSFRAGTSNLLNKVSVYIKKVGTPSSATVRIVADNNDSPSTSELTSGTLNASLVTTTYGWIDVTLSSTPPLIDGERYWLVIDIGNNNASRYYVWGKHDNSGYGNGVGKYTNNWNGGVWSDANGDFGFRTWMGGVATKIQNLTVPYVTDSLVHANTITSSTISALAKCQSLSSSTVSGNVECGNVTTSTIAGNVVAENVTNSTISGDLTCETQSGNTVTGDINCPTPVDPPADPAPQTMPISQGNIDQWRTDAQAGGQIVGDENITNNTSLGPKEITGNLILATNNVTLTVTGTLYVHGNIDISNGSAIRCAAFYGINSCVIVANGWIHVENNGVFGGSGQDGSFIMLLTTLPCNGAGANCTHHGAAIDVHNNAQGVIFYASNGMINIHNTVNVSEATANKLQLDNEAVVTYNQGLADANFASGPGAAWVIAPKTWREVL